MLSAYPYNFHFFTLRIYVPIQTEMASYTTWKQDDWMSQATPLVTILLGVFATAWLLPKCISYVRLAAIPIIGADIGGEEQRRQAYLKSARKLYNDGYKKVGSFTVIFGDC